MMNAVLKYPGAKHRLAKWINEYIPTHTVYLEPFFGSGAIFFYKNKSHIETINDLNDDVVNFFKVLRDKPNEFIDAIYFTPYSRTEYKESYICSEKDTDIEKARKFCVRCWQGFGCSNRYQNGFKSGQQTKSPNPARAFAKLPETLQFAAQRLKNVQIENLPAVELLNRYDTEDVFVYCDPPYVSDTRKGYLYKHEMTNEEHVELLNILKKHPGRILLSGYDNEIYNDILTGWKKAKQITTAEGGVKRTEVLWMNYDTGQIKLDIHI